MKSTRTTTGPTDQEHHEVAALEEPQLDADQLEKLANRLDAILASLSTTGDRKLIMDVDALSEASEPKRKLVASVEPAEVAEARRWTNRLLSDATPAAGGRGARKPLREGKRPAAPVPPVGAEAWAKRLLS
jgi:hypothetical protein